MLALDADMDKYISPLIGLRPLVEAFFTIWAKEGLIMLFWPILGSFCCSVVTFVTFSSNLNNFEKNSKTTLKKKKKRKKSIKKPFFFLITNEKNMKKERKNGFFHLLVLLSKEISLRPELSSQPGFRIQGGSLNVTEQQQEE